MSSSSPVAIGEVLAGKYRIDRVLGEGGMGVVVAAHHLELDQPVAIKFLLDNVANSAEGAERFRREARAAAKIQSDHVVRVLDVGLLESGTRYMVMEFLEGQDLSEELEKRRQLGIEESIGYVLEALDAIGQAHAVGIVHRDLKPANLFLARRTDGSTRIKVLDFGISKSLSTASAEALSLTRTSAWMGSPLYMAPEQMQSARDVDGRADIWSIGAILYELISGQPPYLAESLPQLCNLLLTTDPAPLSSVRPDVPAEVNDAVMRCLARNVQERWQTVSDLRGALLSTISTTSTFPRVPNLAVSLAATELRGPFDAAETQPPQELRTAVEATRPKVGERTQESWDAGVSDSNRSRGRKPLWIAVGGVGALVAAVALVLGLGGSEPLEDSSSEVSSSAAAPQAAPATEASTSVQPLEPPTSGEEAGSEEPPEPSVEEATEAEKPMEPEKSATTAPTPPPKTTSSRVGVRPSSSSPRPTSPPSPSKHTSPADSGISDFGGRR